MINYKIHLAIGLCGVCCLLVIPGQNGQELPKFAEPIPNVTASVGREAILQCTIDNLGSYKVAWIKLDTQTLLSYQLHVITRDKRLKVTNSNDRQWFLHIRDLNVTDRGFYMCQINTEPMVSQLGFLDVMVPPSILEEETSTDTVVDERSRVSLKCKASGYPTPNISWRREDGVDINVGPLGNQKSKVSKVEGEFLNITQVTREDMAAYLCIASNKVPPSVSKRILLKVNFQPKIRVNNQMVGAAIGSDVTLGCKIEASPRPLTSWIRHDNAILITNKKYELLEKEKSYMIEMHLKIKDLNEKDFGPYKCVAKNTFGEKEGFVRLIEIPPPTSVPQSTQLYETFVPIYKGPTEHQVAKNDTPLPKKSYGVPATNSLRDESHHLFSEKQMSPANLDDSIENDEIGRRSNQLPTQKSKPSTSASGISVPSLLLLILVLLMYHHSSNCCNQL